MLGVVAFGFWTVALQAAGLDTDSFSATLSLKVPGNPAVAHSLTLKPAGEGQYNCMADAALPLTITRRVEAVDGGQRIIVTLNANEDVYFNYGEQLNTGYRHNDCQFYMPGFWYRRNLRSPKQHSAYCRVQSRTGQVAGCDSHRQVWQRRSYHTQRGRSDSFG